MGQREIQTQPRAVASFRAGEIEAWGRGIERVIEACRQADTPEPQIRLEARDFWFEFPFSEDYLESVAVDREPGSRTGKTTQEITQETTQERIVALLRQEPTLTRKALADRVGITADGVKYHLEDGVRPGKLKFQLA